MFLDDDRIAVAPRARAHPASAGGVGEGGLACDPARTAADVLQPNEKKWPAAVEGEPPPLAVPPPLL